MTKWTVRFVVLCACLLASASLYAHHSLAGVYTLGKEAKVTGAFKAFRLVNPHSSLKLDVKGGDGQLVEWAIIGGSVQAAREARGRQDDGPNALKPGMKSPSRSCRRIGRQESDRAAGGDHLPRRPHGAFPLARRIDGGVAAVRTDERGHHEDSGHSAVPRLAGGTVCLALRRAAAAIGDDEAE